MAAIYARLSVDTDERKSESIETQVTLIKEFVDRHNAEANKEYELVVYDIYSDLGKTGTNFERAGFERMMDDVSAGCFCGVVEAERFSRHRRADFSFPLSFCIYQGYKFIEASDYRE